MSENGQSKNDDGIAAAETKAECRDGSLRSASLSPEPSSTGEKTEMDPELTGKESAPRAEGRMGREEFESQYRNNPVFATFFEKDTEKDSVKPSRYVMVGGLRVTPKRFLILLGFFIVIQLCLGACFYFALADLGKSRNYARAKALYEAGDYDAAKDMFIKVLTADPNKEDAIVALADIYNRFGDWNNESFFRQRLMRLNPLKPEYFNEFMDSAFRAGNYDVIYSRLRLKVIDGEELDPDIGALYLISALRSGHVLEGKTFYREMKALDPNWFSGSERGRFAEMLAETDKMDGPRAREFASFLDGAQDTQIRFETILVLLNYYSALTDAESEAKTEELLREASSLNNFIGAPLLANYYFMRFRFDDAIRVCEEFQEKKATAFMQLLLGESYALGGHPEKLLPYSQSLRSAIRVRQSKVIASYVDALSAFCEGDSARLHQALLESGSTIDTPLSSLMRLQAAVTIDSPKEILQTLSSIMRGRPFMDFRQRARTAALMYLMDKAGGDLASDPDMLSYCAEIASLIQMKDDDVSFLRRIIVLDLFKRHLLKQNDIQNALATFPGDIVFLRIAAEYYLDSGEPSRAMEYISAYDALNIPNKPSIAVLHIRALHLLNLNDEAEREFRTLLKNSDDDSLLFPYYEFCVDNKFYDSLKTLADWLESLPADSPKRSALPFVRAEILYSEGKKDQAVELFEKNSADDPRFVFHAAMRLAAYSMEQQAEHPDPQTAEKWSRLLDVTVKRYLSIMDTYPDKVQLNLAISGIYAAKGDAESAMAYAKAAWQQNRNNQRARFCYAQCLFDNGQVAEAINVLDFPQYQMRFPDDMLNLWKNAMRLQLKADFDSARYIPARDKAKHFLIYFPQDEEVQEYIRKIEENRRQEKQNGRS